MFFSYVSGPADTAQTVSPESIAAATSPGHQGGSQERRGTADQKRATPEDESNGKINRSLGLRPEGPWSGPPSGAHNANEATHSTVMGDDRAPRGRAML